VFLFQHLTARPKNVNNEMGQRTDEDGQKSVEGKKKEKRSERTQAKAW
jgi:hypothetical protein